MNWGSRMTNEPKIPSVISYSDPNNGERQFGADLSASAITMINTKLELDAQDTKVEELDLIIHMLDGMKCLNFEHIKASKGMPEYTWKTPENIIQDYIARAFDPFWEATDYMAEIRTTAPVDIVVTFPVVSSDPLEDKSSFLLDLAMVIPGTQLNFQGDKASWF